MKILNGKEAFEAMMAGRKIMCRAVGELMDFDDLEKFPATIFAMPGYEFCIKVETMELAGITFSRPLTLDDVMEDQEIFIVYPDHISQVKYSKQCGEHFACVRNGFAQADQENAVLQLEALGELFGRVICYPSIIDNTGKAKKKRSAKAKNDTDQTSNQAGPVKAIPNIEKLSELEEVQPIDANVQSPSVATEVLAIDTNESEAIETDPVKIVEKFTAQINACTTNNAVLSLRPIFMANGNLDREQHQYLCKLTEDKLLELDPEQYTPKVEKPSENLSVSELKRLQEEAEKVTQNKANDVEYQNLLSDLIKHATNATTPIEANALVQYTKSWTEVQRKPLLDAIHKRLVQLNDAAEKPSIAIRIQHAKDLTELDSLEIDVSACDSFIQPKLMEMVETRRIELSRNHQLEGFPL